MSNLEHEKSWLDFLEKNHAILEWEHSSLVRHLSSARDSYLDRIVELMDLCENETLREEVVNLIRGTQKVNDLIESMDTLAMRKKSFMDRQKRLDKLHAK
jgi:hypothetical protein